MSNLNQLTIDVARVLENHGVSGTQYNECMNNLRAQLQDHIKYADPDNAMAAENHYGHTKWFELWKSKLRCWHESI